MKKYKILLPIFLFFLSLSPVLAASGSYQVGGTNIYIGRSADLVVTLTTSGDIQAAGGVIGSSDSSCVRINSVSAIGSVNINGNKFAYPPNGNNIPSGTRIVNVNITGLRACSARITISGAEVTSAEQGDLGAGVNAGTINVSEPPSSNNNLASLSINVGSISFSKDNTNYSVNVDSSVSSVNIQASAEDKGARIEGAGTRSIGYGNNALGVKVIAPSGDVKTYTINVYRKDDRSTNNNLSSLSITNGTLNDTFNKDTTNYRGKVPFEVETANISAVAEDGKATVSISGNRGLISEETSNVTITVRAENGATKTYTIAITRGKDPNKKLSNDNFLTELKPSIGILSPVFNKEKTDYVIYLPYEVESISFQTKISDTKYGVLKTEGPDTLAAGLSNIFKFNVTAEDESVRTYTVVVKRAVNPDATSSSNTYLKSIKINNGDLLFTNGKKVTDFNKTIKTYYYKQGTGFSYEAETEDPNASVTTVVDGSVIQFIVEAPNGEFSIYTLDLYGRYNNIFRYILVYIAGVATGLILFKFITKPKNKINNIDEVIKKVKKNKKD